jgi:murein DD-endopeptidase MepM/ murein hydrolase activator NlpD
MIKDYKSIDDLDGFRSHRRHPRLGFLTLATLALCATGIYASLQLIDSGHSPSKSTLTSPETVAPAVVDAPSPEPRAEKVIALTLPSKEETSLAETTATEESVQTGNAVPTTASIAPEEKSTPPEIEQDLSIPAPELASTTESEIQIPGAPVSPEEAALLEEVAASTTWIDEEVKSGDSLAAIFKRLNLSPTLLHNIINSSKEAKQLAKIRPGQTFRVHLADNGDLIELVHQRNKVESFHISTTEDGEGFTNRLEIRDLERRVATASGTITDSLYQSAQRSGLSDSLIMELANIFGWDIDFALEIRAGDHFSLIYEENYLDGEKYDNGRILAAEFGNRGRIFRALRYEDNAGNNSYYSPDGKSMRKAFLRAPVDFRRISSRFTRERYHPVLGKKRPHRGVDYAAATGTPIKAAGNGKVIFRGRKGGYGNTIIIQHGNEFTTLYAHLHKFRSKVKQGTRVKQGQVIGYVGKTGLATGPHLHYEFRKNGVHRNPLTVKLPAAKPIDKKYLADFREQSAPLLAQLDQLSTTMLAKADTDL